MREEAEDLLPPDRLLLCFDELFLLEERALDFEPRELLLLPPRDPPLLDPPERFEPPERFALDFPPERLRAVPELDFFELEAFDPERLLPPPDDFFPLEDFPPDDLPLREDLPPLEDRWEPDDFVLLRTFEVEGFLPPEDLPLLLDDFPEPMPVTRFAAPAACDTARLAVSTF